MTELPAANTTNESHDSSLGGQLKSVAAHDPFDLNLLRMDQSFAESSGVKKIAYYCAGS